VPPVVSPKSPLCVSDRIICVCLTWPSLPLSDKFISVCVWQDHLSESDNIICVCHKSSLSGSQTISSLCVSHSY
jgi:hypothetical protein